VNKSSRVSALKDDIKNVNKHKYLYNMGLAKWSRTVIMVYRFGEIDNWNRNQQALVLNRSSGG
jgi:hypothetical protein